MTKTTFSNSTRSEILRTLQAKPFSPHPALHSADLQTILGISLPYFKTPHPRSERRLIPISNDTTIAADFTLQKNPQAHATMILVPGIYGVSTNSILLAMEHKAYHAGYNVVRINLPNQSGTAHLTKKYYYIGQTEVITGTMRALAKMKLEKIFLVGISYGGNICAKALAELDAASQKRVLGTVLMSPAIDPLAALKHMEHRQHPLYERSIIRRLNKLNKARSIADPDNFAYNPQKTLRTWMDTHMTAPEPIGWNHKDSGDYLTRNSALPLMPLIKVPTLIIHAEDDPLVPFEPIISKEVMDNPYILRLATRKGGHCGFIAKRKYKDDLDRHWDQNRAMEFFGLLSPMINSLK